MRILLVEDDPHHGLHRQRLKEEGHSVDHADNGKDGAIVVRHDGRIALMDNAPGLCA